MGPGDLKDILSRIAVSRDPKLLVGYENSDDAAVYALTDQIALVQTVDFITPIVDDPYAFGQIAAANSLSDIYAMGGTPILALNLCCFPEADIEAETLRAILEGGASKIAEAGASLAGGHSIKDRELKYGLAVTGTIHPKDIKANHGAKVGDAVLLTKPIGTGILTTARKKDLIDDQVLEPAVKAMMTLNREASMTMVEMGANSATDITGFGVAVHLLEVAKASGVSIRISFQDMPWFPEVRRLSGEGVKTGLALKNEQAAFGFLSFDSAISREDQLLFFDPQTSGGLAIFIPEKREAEMLARLMDRGISAARVGTVEEGPLQLRVG